MTTPSVVCLFVERDVLLSITWAMGRVNFTLKSTGMCFYDIKQAVHAASLQQRQGHYTRDIYRPDFWLVARGLDGSLLLDDIAA